MNLKFLTLPLTDPVFVFAAGLALILVIPRLFERLRLPGVVGLILAGVAFGPHGVDLLHRGNAMILLATVGLMYVMFLAGLEIDIDGFAGSPHRSLLSGTLSFVIPFLLGLTGAVWMGFPLPAALLLGAVIAPTTLVAYPIISRYGLVSRASVATAVGGTILTDILCLTVLSLVAGGKGTGDLWFWASTLGALLALAAVTLLALPRLGRWFLRNVFLGRDQEFLFVLLVLFGVGALSKLLGIQAIVGAFFAGLALNRLIPAHGPLMTRISFVGNALFIPFFLLATGMLVDAHSFASHPESWLIAGFIVLAAMVGKWLAQWLTGAILGFSKLERWNNFGLTVSHAAASLAIAMTGVKVGLLDAHTLNGVIAMILVTCLIAGFVVERTAQRLALADGGHDATPAGIEPERILLAVGKPTNIESLTNLAILLRSPKSPEPLFPLVVVRPGGRADTRGGLSSAEGLLARVGADAAGADVPVMPLTRLSHNVATAISQAAVETRSSTIVMGWKGERSLGARFFGTVIDQVVEHSEDAMVVVGRLNGPLNPVSRVVTIVPPMSAQHPDAANCLRLIKRLACRLGAKLEVWDLGDTTELLARALIQSPPAQQYERRSLPGWSDVKPLLMKTAADSLIAVVSARESDPSWDPELGKLAPILEAIPKQNFLIVYPGRLVAGEAMPEQEVVLA